MTWRGPFYLVVCNNKKNSQRRAAASRPSGGAPTASFGGGRRRRRSAVGLLRRDRQPHRRAALWAGADLDLAAQADDAFAHAGNAPMAVLAMACDFRVQADAVVA